MATDEHFRPRGQDGSDLAGRRNRQMLSLWCPRYITAVTRLG